MAQSISQEAIGATGLPGATAASRHAGATTSGAPTTGTFAVGDYVVDQTGKMWVCSVSGTPGTWVQVGSPTTSVTMGGDVTGNSATSTVAKLQGTAVSATAPTSNQVLQYNGTAWTPATFSAGAPGTTVKSFIATDFSIVASNTVYDVTSISLTAGTWLVNYQALINRGGNAYYDLWIGTTSGSVTGQYSGITIFTTTNSPSGAGAGAYSVTVASTTTLYLQVLGNQSGTVTVAGYTGKSINTSGLTAVRTA